MSWWHVRRAVRALQTGGVVMHATEGVWGLACDPFDEAAVARLLVLKKRNLGKGLIVIGEAAERFENELDSLGSEDRARIVQTWPGRVTWILPNQMFPYWITGGRDEVAVRVPGHRQARELCREFGGPLVSTSANQSGQPAAVNGLQARRRFRAAEFPTPDDYILPGEVATPGRPSLIRTLAGSTLRE